MDLCAGLNPEQFSVPLFQRVFGQIQQQCWDGFTPTVGTLSDLNEDEMSHIVGIYQNMKTVNENALRDCVATVQSQRSAASVSSNDDLLAFRERMKQRKGIKG